MKTFEYKGQTYHEGQREPSCHHDNLQPATYCTDCSEEDWVQTWRTASDRFIMIDAMVQQAHPGATDYHARWEETDGVVSIKVTVRVDRLTDLPITIILPDDDPLLEPTPEDEKVVSAFDEPHLLGDAPRPRTDEAPEVGGAGIYTLHRELRSMTIDAFAELSEWHLDTCPKWSGLPGRQCDCHNDKALWDRWNALRLLEAPKALEIPAEHLDALAAERARQEAKFPNQHLPNYDLAIEILPAVRAKRYTDKRAEAGYLSWSDVLLEEVAEAIEEADEGDVAKLRTELIQVAAVALRWIEDLDRQERA